LSSTQVFTPISPLPIGIEADEFPPGESHTTLQASNGSAGPGFVSEAVALGAAAEAGQASSHTSVDALPMIFASFMLVR